LRRLGNDAPTVKAARDIELQDAADLEFSMGGTLSPSTDAGYDFIGTGGKLLGEKISHMGIPDSNGTWSYNMKKILVAD